MTTWLLFDVSYLSYRALHSTGGLKSGDIPTGVLYGVISEVIRCMERFGTYQCCFCFDVGRPLREQLLPGYKSTRREKRKQASPTERRAHREMREQIDRLHFEILPALGFRNIFGEAGYEADDVIASLSQHIPPPHNSVIVSSDEDLYQLLDSRCMIYNLHKQKVINERSFVAEYGITPSQWVDVKAVAGCDGDDIPGVKGVGEKTAIKYLTGKLKAGKVFDRIVLENRWKTNLELVRLPFKGCPVFQRKRDKVTHKRWRRVMDDLGFPSLRNAAPLSSIKD